MIEFLVSQTPSDARALLSLLCEGYRVHPMMGRGGGSPNGSGWEYVHDPDLHRNVMDPAFFRVQWGARPVEVGLAGYVSISATWRRTKTGKWSFKSWGTGLHYPGHTMSNGGRQTGQWLGSRDTRPPKPTVDRMMEYASGPMLDDFLKGCSNTGCACGGGGLVMEGEVLTESGLTGSGARPLIARVW